MIQQKDLKQKLRKLLDNLLNGDEKYKDKIISYTMELVNQLLSPQPQGDVESGDDLRRKDQIISTLKNRIRRLKRYYEAKKNALEEQTKELRHRLEAETRGGKAGSISEEERKKVERLCGFGETYMRNSQVDMAIRCFDEILEIDPFNNNVRYRLGLIHEERGELDKAVVLYKRVLEIEPKSWYASLRLAMLYDRKGIFEEAIKGYKNTIRIAPNCVEAFFYLGIIYKKRGLLADAVSIFKRAVKCDISGLIAHKAQDEGWWIKGMCRSKGDSMSSIRRYFEDFVRYSHLNLARIYRIQKEYKAALAEFNTLLEFMPGHIESHFGLGEIHLLNGDLEASIRHYKNAMENDTLCAPYAHYYLGVIYMDKGILNKALDEFSTALSLLQATPSQVQTSVCSPEQGFIEDDWRFPETELKIGIHYYLAILNKKSGRIHEAVSGFKNVLELAGDCSITHINTFLTHNLMADTHYNLGAIFEENGGLNDAYKEYEMALSCEPDRVDILFLMGNLLKRLGRIDESIAAFNKGLKADPANLDGHYTLGVIYKEVGDYSKAVWHLKKAVNINKDHEGAHYNLGLIYKDGLFLDGALWEFKRVLDINPKDHNACYNIGLIYKEKGMLDDAIIEFNKAIEMDSHNLQIYYELGILYKSKGMLDNAISMMKKVMESAQYTGGQISTEQADQEVNREDIPLIEDVHYELGMMFKSKGMLDEAVKEFEKTIALKSNYAEAYNNRGIIYDDKGMFDRAIEDYKEALKHNSNYAEAYNNLGVSFMKKGKIEEAISYYKIALEINPDYPEAHNNLGVCYKEMDMLEEAISHLEEAIEIRPDYAEAYNNLGVAYSSLGYFDEAISKFKDAEKIDKDYLDARYNLAITYSRLKMYEDAVSELKKVVLTNPNDANTHHNLGIVYARQKEYQKAIIEYKKAIKTLPDLAEAHYNLAVAYHEIGMKVEARQAFLDYKRLRNRK